MMMMVNDGQLKFAANYRDVDPAHYTMFAICLQIRCWKEEVAGNVQLEIWYIKTDQMYVWIFEV